MIIVSTAAWIPVKSEVVRHDLLAQDVVGIQADAVALTAPHRCLLPGGQLAQLGHPELDHEPPAGVEVANRVVEDQSILITS